MKRGLGIALLALVAGIAGLHTAAPRAGAVAAASGLTITKIVSGSNVTTPGGSITYTITVSNPTAGSISLDCVIDSLPTMFTYHTGSTTGPGNPGEPDTLNCTSFGTGTAWFFDGTSIGAGNSVSWSFTADVSPDESAGCFLNVATAYYSGTSSTTGPTAPAAVIVGGTPVPSCGQQTPPPIVRSATPTFTATPVATNTSVPTQASPTATMAPPTATPPGSGAGGAISAPNTGDGSASTQHGAASRSMAVLLALAAAGGLLVTGAGIAARRSR